MQINDKFIEKLAALSKIELAEGEKDKVVKDLNKVLSLIDKLNELDTSQIEPLVSMTDENPGLRKDLTAQTINKDAVLKNAPMSDESFFRIPKVVKK